MNHWLVKSDPESWSWQDHLRAHSAEWDGVRNHQAKGYLKAMAMGDHAFFYHSGDQRCICGIVRVVKTYYPDPTDKTHRFGMVDFQIVKPFVEPVTLARIKCDARLQQLVLVRNSRLSVQPVDPASWKIICRMSQGTP